MPDGGQHFPALVLNADFRPLSYFPLSLWCWQDAVKAVFLDRVSVLSEYEREVRSPSLSMRLPSVIALKDYIRRRAAPPSPGSTCSCATASPASIAASGTGAGPDLRPRDPAQPRRAHHLGKRRYRLRRLQSAQGLPPAARMRACTRAPPRASRRHGSCRTTAARSRPTTCTRAGATISTGIANWRAELPSLRHAGCSLSLAEPPSPASPVNRR